MQVSIIGTNGFLSTAIAQHCNAKKWQLDMYGLEDPIGHAYDHFFKINLLESQIDYTQLSKSDIIIYASGAGIQNNLNESAYLIYALNVTAPISICNGLRINNYKGIFISFGSYFELGQTTERHAFTEHEVLTSTFKAPNDYTISKRMLSRFIDGYSHEFTHWHFYIPTIYGETENPMRLIPYTINSIRNCKPLNFTDGNQVRSYIYVNEIPIIIEKAYEVSLPTGLYNIGGSDTLSVKEIVNLIRNLLDEEIPICHFGTVDRKDVSMKYLELDGSKLYNAIGYKCSISMKDVIFKY